MEQINIYTRKNESIVFIISCIIMLIVAVVGFALDDGNTTGTNKESIWIMVFMVLGNIVVLPLKYKDSPRMIQYVNIKKESITFIVITLAIGSAFVFLPVRVKVWCVLGGIFFTCLLVSAIYEVFRRKPILILNEGTFIDKTTLGVGEVNYEEIKDVFIYGKGRNERLIIVVEEMDKKLRKLNVFKRFLYMGKQYIEVANISKELPIRDLLEVIGERKRK